MREGGNILLKFWLHSSEDEQLRRFRERETVPWKKYKITPEDWRNRDKRRDYLVAADEMFARTSTDYAPWHIVAAEDKKCARLEVLRLYRDALAGLFQPSDQESLHDAWANLILGPIEKAQ